MVPWCPCWIYFISLLFRDGDLIILSFKDTTQDIQSEDFRSCDWISSLSWRYQYLVLRSANLNFKLILTGLTWQCPRLIDKSDFTSAIDVKDWSKEWADLDQLLTHISLTEWSLGTTTTSVLYWNIYVMFLSGGNNIFKWLSRDYGFQE